MTWHLIAGLAQLVLVAVVAVVDLRARRVDDLLLFGLPMVALAAGTLAGVHWVIVIAAVFYSIWLLDQLLSWWRPARPVHAGRPKRTRREPAPQDASSRPARAVLGLVSLAVLAVTWIAVTPAVLG